MKNRITMEAHLTKSLFDEYTEIRRKCDEFIKYNELKTDKLEQFREMEQLFVVDLNLLTLEQITMRRNKVMEAIDDIMAVESDLKILLAKRQKVDDPQEKTDKNQRSLPIRTAEQKQPNQTRPLVRNRKHSEIVKPQRPKLPNRELQLEKQQIQSLQNQLRFDHAELLNVWGRYKATPNESSDDKFDRLGKLIGNLRVNLRSILLKQKQANLNTSIAMHPEYLKLIQQVEALKTANDQLRRQNIQLQEENKSLREIITEKAYSPNKVPEVLYDNNEYKIIKILKVQVPRIQISLPALSELIRKAETVQQQRQESPVREAGKQSSEEMSTNSEINSTSNIQEIGGKLAELRNQRRQAFDDDDLWNEIEKIKI